MEQLFKAEIKYKDVFNYANDGMYLSIYENDGLRIIDVNNKALEMLGYTRDEFLNLDTRALVPPDFIESYEKKKQKLFLRNKIVTESFYLTKSGRCIPVELSISKLTIGAKEVYLTIARDISERKRLEELKLVEERMVRTRNIAKIMVVYTDLTGKFISITPQYCKLLGYEEEELLGKKFIDITYEKDITRNNGLYERLINKDLETY